MKKLRQLIFRFVGVLLMALAFLQWITFDYPDISPWSASILTPGVLGQALNWGIVCVLGSVGWLLFSIGSAEKSQGETTPNDTQ